MSDPKYAEALSYAFLVDENMRLSARIVELEAALREISVYKLIWECECDLCKSVEIARAALQRR